MLEREVCIKSVCDSDCESAFLEGRLLYENQGKRKKVFLCPCSFAICVLLCISEFYTNKIYYVKFVNIRTYIYII